MKLVPGTLVTPNVYLSRPLAEGSMGSVWVADHRTLETQVAVKFIAEDGRNDPELVQRFAREAKAAARIKSHHVVQIFDYGVTAAGVPYMVLELLEGETLAERLASAGALSLRETATVVTHVARALANAHAFGIVHRDIKPANVFLTTVDERLFCKVFDFGVAKKVREQDEGRRRELTLDGILIGTPQFMSPEQLLNGSGVTAQADLWSLAVVAYRCLTGRLPFAGRSFEELSVSVFSSRFTPPSAVRPELPAAVDEFFERAFRKKREERFASAQELARTFEGLADLDQEPLSIPPSQPPASQTLFETTLPLAAAETAETLSGATTKRSTRARRLRARAWNRVAELVRRKKSFVWVALALVALAAGASTALFGDRGARGTAEPIASPEAVAASTTAASVAVSSPTVEAEIESEPAPVSEPLPTAKTARKRVASAPVAKPPDDALAASSASATESEPPPPPPASPPRKPTQRPRWGY